MPTFRVPSLSLRDEEIPKSTIRYFTRRFQHELHELVSSEVRRVLGEGLISQRKLANRLGKDAAQINRWLGAPGNWTLDTVAQLMVGVAVDPRSVLKPLRERRHPVAIAAQVAASGTLEGIAEFDDSGPALRLGPAVDTATTTAAHV